MMEAMCSSIDERLQSMTEMAGHLGGEWAQQFVAQLTLGFAQGVRDDLKKQSWMQIRQSSTFQPLTMTCLANAQATNSL